MRGAIPGTELKICVSLKFRAVYPPNPARRFIQENQNVRFATAACNQKFRNVRFATAACTKMYETSEQCPPQLAAYKNHRILKYFTTVLDVRPARSDERVAPPRRKMRISPQF